LCDIARLKEHIRMGSEYWDRGPASSRRISRRAALRGGVISAAGLSAAFIAAFGGKSNNNNSNAAPATNTNANSAAAAGTPAASAAAAAATAKGTAAAVAIKRGGSLKYRGAEVFTSLDPTYSSSYMDLFMSFEPLLGVNDKGEPGITDASLATAYEQVDPTTLVIHTRNGVKFHDGTDFNAQAVKFSLDRATAPTPP